MAIAGHTTLKMNLKYAGPSDEALSRIGWWNPNDGHQEAKTG
jgi:hypothetical protein